MNSYYPECVWFGSENASNQCFVVLLLIFLLLSVYLYPLLVSLHSKVHVRQDEV